MIHGVIFDLGSTLIYSDDDHRWGLILPRMRRDLWGHLATLGYQLDQRAFLNRFDENFRAFDEQRQASFVEYTIAFVLNRTLGELSAPLLEGEALAGALQAYYAYSEARWQLMPGAQEALARLRGLGLRVGLLSNAGDVGNIERLIDRFDLRRHLDPIVISAAIGLRKPNPRAFERVLTAWGVGPGAVVMIGDTLGADILGAQLLGMRHIWLTAAADHPANVAHRETIVPEAVAEDLTKAADLVSLWVREST
ncbi:MAG: HAD family hydrolase [Anaerolineales bacterium]|nr:HAD family hydrolase [Anaerolineales bacterium]